MTATAVAYAIQAEQSSIRFGVSICKNQYFGQLRSDVLSLGSVHGQSRTDLFLLPESKIFTKTLVG